MIVLGDPDTGDGQGNCNLTRTAAAEAMLAWLETDPTGVNDADYLIIGDLNAYAMEDPITALKDGGYTDLVNSYVGAEAYSYIYYGQAGYLDHALASPSLLSQVTGATIWHINADEPKVLDYNTEFKTDGQIDSLYNVDPYRASDHDPVIVGLDLASPDLNLTKDVIPTTDVELGDTLTYTLTLSNSGQMDTMGLLMTDTLPLSTTFGGFITANGATEDSGKVTFSGTVGADSEVGIIYTATVAMDYGLYGETITNTLMYDSANAGSGEAKAAFTVAEAPVLELAKMVSPKMDVDLGEMVTYTLTLTNTGAAMAYDVALTDTLPAGLIGAGFSWLDDLAGGASVEATYTATVAMDTALYGKTITNSATYNSANAGSGDAQAAFTVVGTGCQPVANAMLDRTPAGALFINTPVRFVASATGSRPFTYTWTLNGASVSASGNAFEHTFTAAGTYTVSTSIVNACGQASATLVTDVQAPAMKQPDLSSSHKSANLSYVQSGDILTYTLLLRNSKAVTASAVLTDPLPAHTSYVTDSAKASAGTVTFVNDEVRWSGQVISGTPVLIEFAVEVLDAPVATHITNVAHLDDGLGHVILLETEAVYSPGYRFTINDGARYTNIPTVTLSLSWAAEEPSISQMRLSNDGGFSTGTGWLPVNTSYTPWQLDTYGNVLLPRTVYALFQGEQGQQYGPFQDDIIYDPHPPTVTQVEIITQTTQSLQAQKGTKVIVRVTARDGNSGVGNR